MLRDRHMERVDELAAVIIAVGAADDGFQGLEPRQVHPDMLADLRPERRHHAKAGRRQVEQFDVKGVETRFTETRAQPLARARRGERPPAPLWFRWCDSPTRIRSLRVIPGRGMI